MVLSEVLDKVLYKVTNPTRYIGNEWNAIKKEWTEDRLKVVLAFPDIYEIGMSHLGLKILYHLLNKEDDILCERTYAPWVDLEKLMREKGIPLFSLETKHAIKDFDILGFTLQYEMSYTNIINMIDLAGLPLLSSKRGNESPLIIGGGSTVFNPEPLAPFFDLFFIGEAESGILQLVEKYRKYRQQGMDKEEILYKLTELPGVYVPGFYKPVYKANKFSGLEVNKKGVKSFINRQIVKNLDKAFYPTDFIVPHMDIVHDRAVVEISRGCTRGCRFCAAGISYRPVRERRKDTIINLADRILESTGYEEISLTSLSTIDYSDASGLIKTMAKRYEDKKINISLPSLRVDSFSVNLAKEVQRVRKSGLTFAPEAGSQRLRDVINKGVNEKELYDAVSAAFNEGWSTIKLYFMIGLPTETKEDLEGLVDMVYKVLETGNRIRKEKNKKMKPIQIHVSVSTFVPKPFTPFQWVKMVNKEEIIEKQDFLRRKLRSKGINFSWNDPELSLLEGVFSRGDRRLADVLITAWEKGARFDGWNEHFSFELWLKSFKEKGLSLDEYLRERYRQEPLPWDHINMGVPKEFLLEELDKAIAGKLTEDCRFGGCTGCNICFELDSRLELVGDKRVD